MQYNEYSGWTQKILILSPQIVKQILLDWALKQGYHGMKEIDIKCHPISGNFLGAEIRGIHVEYTYERTT